MEPGIDSLSGDYGQGQVHQLYFGKKYQKANREVVTVFNDTYQVPDLLESPHVSCQGGIRFYAGAPLKTREGYRLGTVSDRRAGPRGPGWNGNQG